MKVVAKITRSYIFGCFLTFWEHPEFFVFLIDLWWKKSPQKHTPGTPKGPPSPATPVAFVPPPPPNLLLNLASLAKGTFSFYLR